MKRDPRNWDKYWLGYSSHIAQGLLTCYLVPAPYNLILLAAFFIIYQVTEYQRCKDMRWAYKNAWPKLGDWISRDLMDWIYGGWPGVVLQSLATELEVGVWMGIRLLLSWAFSPWLSP